MRRALARVAIAMFLCGCASWSSEREPPEPDPLWPERLHYNFTGAIAPELPVDYVLNGDFRVELESGRQVTVRDHSDVGMYAPDLGIITLVRYGYHGMGADSSTTIVQLVSGERLEVLGFVASAPRRDLLLVDGSGFLYEGGSLSIVQVTERGFGYLGSADADYVFEPVWASSNCVDLRRLPEATDADISLAADSNGQWRQRPGRCA